MDRTLPWPTYRGSMRPAVPLDLACTLSCGQAFRWCLGAEWQWRGVVRGTVVDLWQRPGGELYWESGPRELTAGELGDYLRLDDDLEAIRRDIGDQRADAAFEAYRGLRILRQEPWETLVSYVVSQMSNVPRISKTVATLSAAYGTPLGDGRNHAFPTPDGLARATLAGLRKLGLGYRAPHIMHIANAVADGEFFLEPLREVPYREAKDRLMELPGVGPKVADCVLLFSLDHLEAFPVDRWVHRAVAEWYHGGAPITERAVGVWAREHFGRHAGYASQYLFHARRAGGPECPATSEAEDSPEGAGPDNG